MMFWVYILYSKSSDKYYIGQTSDLVQRLEMHNNHLFEGAFTSLAKDWEIFLQIPCESRNEAICIEKHIKSMKKRSYYSNLKKYPEMVDRLIEKFRGNQSR